MTPPSFYFERIQKTLQEVAETEHEYLLRGGDRDVHTSFMPYQPADFLAIMSDVVAAANGEQFLDVGCGPGTKMRLAQEIFGLYPVGVEIDAEMARKARESFGAAVYTGDALTNYTDIYSTVDIIWLYRPFKDAVKEDELERLIMHRMKPGAILAGGHWEMNSSPKGWNTVVDDCETRGGATVVRGAWMKPGTITAA
jgi:trans-aconitate methyltransferase